MTQTVDVTLETMPVLAHDIMRLLSRTHKNTASVILLRGDIGAGKTTFTQALGALLGVTAQVQSPTFTLKREYDTTHERFTHLIHIDAYRFTDVEESKVLKFKDDERMAENIIVVEWPHHMGLHKADIEISFEVKDEFTRTVTVTYER